MSIRTIYLWNQQQGDCHDLNLYDQEVACSASDRQGSYFESCVWRTVSSHSSHHSQEVFLAQFSLCAQRWPKARFISFFYIFSFEKGLGSFKKTKNIELLWLYPIPKSAQLYINNFSQIWYKRYRTVVYGAGPTSKR